MKLSITHQDSYSRGELLLRTFFGWLYIMIPHGFVMGFVQIYTSILSFLAFWVVLFTGKYPQGWFETQVNMMNWGARLSAATTNLADGYPEIGLSGTSDKVKVEIAYPDSVSRASALLRTLLGVFYVGIPHGFCLCFRMIAHGFIIFIAWWIILFTGKIPENMHSFLTGTYRWLYRMNAYLALLSDEYPAFSGKE